MNSRSIAAGNGRGAHRGWVERLACVLAVAAGCAGLAAAGVPAGVAWDRLREGNGRFARGAQIFPRQDVGRRAALRQGQHPFAVVVCCSDSVVPPEALFDEGLGDLYVVRTEGPTVGDVEARSVAFAVDRLGVNLVLVLGHGGCEAVTADADPRAAGRGSDAAVDANVRDGVAALATLRPALAARARTGALRILGARYEPGSGKVTVVDTARSDPAGAAVSPATAPVTDVQGKRPDDPAPVAWSASATAPVTGAAPAVAATPPATARAAVSPDWTSRLKIGGDIRLRYDQTHYTRSRQGGVDRERLQERLRLRVEAGLPGGIAGKVQLNSGTPQGLTGFGSNVSANRTMDGLSMPSPAYVDKACVQWDPVEALSVRGGRMENPFWLPASADLIWSGDFTPEGVAQKVVLGRAGATRVSLVCLQMVADEDAANVTRTDQWMFGYQAGLELPLPAGLRLKTAGSFLDWTDPRSGSYGANAVQDGNVRTGADASGTGFSDGVRVNEFGIAVADLELDGSLGRLPVAVLGTYANNLRARAARSPLFRHGAEREGWQGGAVLGKAADPWTWEAGYLYKFAASECTFADIAENNFGDKGGLNRRGHIAWIGFAPSRFVVAKIRYAFDTKLINEELTKSPNGRYLGKDLNRLNVDVSVSF